MRPNYSTSMQFNNKDYVKRIKLDKANVAVIDTWRRGADVILDELRKKKLVK